MNYLTKSRRIKCFGNLPKYLLFVLILIPFTLFAQFPDNKQFQTDYKNQDLRSNLLRLDDTLKVLAFIKRASDKFYAGGEPDSIYQLLHSAISLSKEINYSTGLARSSGQLGFDYYIHHMVDSARIYLRSAINATGENDMYRLALFHLWYGWTLTDNSSELDSSLQMFRLSNKYAIEGRDTFMMQAAAAQIIQSYLISGQTIEATKLCLRMKNLAVISRDTSYLIRNACLLAQIFGQMNLRDKQRDMIYTALKLPESSKDTSLLLEVYGMAAELYMERYQYDSVLYYTRKTESLSHKMISFYPEIQITNWVNKTGALLKTNQADSARYYYFKAVRVLDNADYPSFYYGELASQELEMGYNSKANKHFKKAAIKAQKETWSTKMETYRILYEHYEAWGKEDKAFQFLKEYQLYKDSLQKNQIAFNAEYLIMEFETEKKEEQIKTLSKERELQSMIATKQKQKKNLAYGSMVLLFFAGSFGFYRFRQYKNIKSKQALSNERLRISRDLHDEVGATLSGISMYSHLAKEQFKSDNREVIINSLNIMQESSDEMVNKLNDIVWLLNPDQSKLRQLIDKLEDYATQMAEPKGVLVTMEIDDGITNLELPLEVRRNIYLIGKEAVNNVVKYSQSSTLNIGIRQSNQMIEFSIQDNGIGFDPDTIKRGNGLNNMQQRADKIGGEIKLIRGIDGGTIIILKCKIT